MRSSHNLGAWRSPVGRPARNFAARMGLLATNELDFRAKAGHDRADATVQLPPAAAEF